MAPAGGIRVPPGSCSSLNCIMAKGLQSTNFLPIFLVTVHLEKSALKQDSNFECASVM